MSDPLVSIVLPTYNGTRYLEQSIESCLAQTYSPLEVIVVDDGSTEDVTGIVLRLTDPRLRLVRHEKNRGLPAALNAGFALASGDFLTWISDDNWFDPQAIEAMVSFLRERPDVALVYADCWVVMAEGDVVGEIVVGSPDDLHKSIRNCIGSCFLYRSQVLDQVGEYNEQLPLVEDYEYWLRIAEKLEIAPYHRKLYYHRFHAGSLTGTNRRNDITRLVLQVRRDRGWSSNAECRRQLSFLDREDALAVFYADDSPRARRKGLAALRNDPRLIADSDLMEVLFGEKVGARIARVFRFLKRTGRGRCPSQ